MHMSNNHTYNGWTNYETWNLALWLDNDECSYNYWRQQTRACLIGADEPPTLEQREGTAHALAQLLQTETEVNAPVVAGFYADILGSAMHSINWREIADHLIDDAVA